MKRLTVAPPVPELYDTDTGLTSLERDRIIVDICTPIRGADIRDPCRRLAGHLSSHASAG